MKVTITHMKAPWPAGAGVGDTVELEGEAVPAWAKGKCVQAADDAEVFVPAQAEAPAEEEAAPAPRKGGKAKAQAEAPAEG
jgi:hypothetical protein